MFIIGASINFNEFTHTDLLLKHQILISGLKNKYENESDNTIIIHDYSKYYNSSVLNEKLQIKQKKMFLDVLIEMKVNSELLKKTMNFNDLIRKKIKSDHLISPVKIFWIKSDFTLIKELLALLASGIIIVLGSLLSNGSMKLGL